MIVPIGMVVVDVVEVVEVEDVEEEVATEEVVDEEEVVTAPDMVVILQSTGNPEAVIHELLTKPRTEAEETLQPNVLADCAEVDMAYTTSR